MRMYFNPLVQLDAVISSTPLGDGATPSRHPLVIKTRGGSNISLNRFSYSSSSYSSPCQQAKSSPLSSSSGHLASASSDDQFEGHSKIKRTTGFSADVKTRSKQLYKKFLCLIRMVEEYIDKQPKKFIKDLSVPLCTLPVDLQENKLCKLLVKNITWNCYHPILLAES